MTPTSTETFARPQLALLSQEDLQADLLALFNARDGFEGRETYIGASEVSDCQMALAYRKLHPQPFTDPHAAGRMWPGTILENTAVQIARNRWGRFLTRTGSNQIELAHPSAPLKGHPDGLIDRRALQERIDEATEKFADLVVRMPDGTMHVLAELPEGDGVFEVKTASSHQFRRFLKEGLSLRYRRQVISNQGMAGRLWSILILFSRENLADCAVFFIPFDGAEYDAAVEDARRTMAAVEKIREGILSEDGGLPAPDTERGFCSSCPIADRCPAVSSLVAVDASKVLPPDEIPDVEAMAEEFSELQPEAKRFDAVKELLRDRLLTYGVLKTLLPSGITISLSERKGRTTASVSVLQKKFPAVAADPEVVTTGDPFYVMTVKEKKP